MGVDGVVVFIEFPLVQCKSSHGTFVSDIENYVIIGWNSVVQPLYFGWERRHAS